MIWKYKSSNHRVITPVRLRVLNKTRWILKHLQACSYETLFPFFSAIVVRNESPNRAFLSHFLMVPSHIGNEWVAPFLTRLPLFQSLRFRKRGYCPTISWIPITKPSLRLHASFYPWWPLWCVSLLATLLPIVSLSKGFGICGEFSNPRFLAISPESTWYFF